MNELDEQMKAEVAEFRSQVQRLGFDPDDFDICFDTNDDTVVIRRLSTGINRIYPRSSWVTAETQPTVVVPIDRFGH